MKELYFIAIVPPKPITESIQKLRMAFAEKYHSEEALKSPVHLTLKEPFMMDPREEIVLKRKLSSIAMQHQVFEHVLQNFGRYQKHAIFIGAEKHPYLVGIKQAIKKMFKTSFYYVQQDQMPFNPHYTIAYCDIAAKYFENAFAEYENTVFLERFICKEYILFKHIGKQWENIEEFRLSGMPKITLFDELIYKAEHTEIISAQS
jgi:2'-5' RNA ligase